MGSFPWTCLPLWRRGRCFAPVASLGGSRGCTWLPHGRRASCTGLWTADLVQPGISRRRGMGREQAKRDIETDTERETTHYSPCGPSPQFLTEKPKTMRNKKKTKKNNEKQKENKQIASLKGGVRADPHMYVCNVCT